MSKTKKIISMLLAAVMVVSMVPVTGVVSSSAYDLEAVSYNTENGVSWNDPTVSEMSFSVDTTGTTEVIRVAAAAGSFSYGDPANSVPYTIVSATPSGVPSAGGYAAVAYGGETPVQPTVKFTITGKKPDQNPTITPSDTNISFGSTTLTTSGDSYTYTFPVQGSGNSLAPHTDIVFTITFLINGVSYKAYAYSHIENILVMNGVLSYHQVDNNDGKLRYSALVQYQSKNMYSRMNGQTWYNSATNAEVADDSYTSVTNRTVGYINYNSTATGGNALLGCGADPADLDGSINAYGSATPNDNIAGIEAYALIKGTKIKDGDQSNKCTHNDTNRGEPIIYMDYTDNLESLNFRCVVQNTEYADFGMLRSSTFTFWNSVLAQPDENDTSINATNVGSSVLSVKSYSGDITAKDYNATSITHFKGTGPTVSASTNVNDNYSTSMGSPYVIWIHLHASGGNRTMNGINGMNIVFKRYDTRDLRAMYDGMLAGTGSYTLVTPTLTAAYGSLSMSFNKGVFPRASMYGMTEANDGDAYDTFIAALKAAGSVLAEPDTTQSQIDTAALNLYNAYYALPTPNYTSNVVINLVDKATGETLTDSDDNEMKMTIPAVPINSTIQVNAPTVTGYSVSGDATLKIDVTGLEATITAEFEYEPQNFNLSFYYNNMVPSISDSSTLVDLDKIGYAYNSEVDLDAINVGTKDHYTFAGWYLQDYTDAEKHAASFANVPKANNGTSVYDYKVTAVEDFYAIWTITPLDINVTPITNKGVELTANKGTVATVQLMSESDTQSVAKPADYNIEGYIFGGYYESYDAETKTFSDPVSWPVSFSFGDSDKEIYARQIDVNGIIAFNSNGGNDIDDITFSATDAAPATITAPADPTRTGYTFAGWYSEADLALWQNDNSVAPTYFADGTETLYSNTGFVAYAAWTPNDVTISFEMGAATSDFDTTNNQMATIYGKADAEIPESEYPPIPTKFGKSFAQWVIQGTKTVFEFGKDTFPLESIVLEPVWSDTKYSAFISIGAYENLSSGLEEVVNPTGASREGLAQIGDVVTFRMTSQTNFFTGSSVFVFMYDNNFYELVGSGTDAFTLNSENEYVAGIDAQHIGVTDNSLFVNNGKWPAGLDSTNYNAMMVTIDPTVTATNNNCEPMADGTWLVEFKLKVKDSASGSGTVYMDNAWTRTADNIMGTMFYGWAETNDTKVTNTYNSVVEPNLDKATVTLSIDETPQVQTTITLNANGGTWTDNTTANKTYTGNAGTEIFDTDAVPYEAPEYAGYELTGWATEDGTDTWVEGFYGTEAQDGKTFLAQWTPNSYTINYYVDEDSAVLWDSEQLAYASAIDGPMYDISNQKAGYDFDGWYYYDDNGSVVDVVLGTTPVPLGGADLYAKWVPGKVNVTVNITYFDNRNQVEASATRTITAITESSLYVDSTGIYSGSIAEANLVGALPVVNGYEFDASNEANKALATTATVVLADGSTVINLRYKAATIVFTLDANGGAYANGDTTVEVSGEFYTAAGAKINDVSTNNTPIREGYDFVGWATSATGSALQQSVIDGLNFNRNTTYYAVWTVMKVDAKFVINHDSATFSDGTTETLVESTYGSAIKTPTVPSVDGYSFLGWNTTADATTALTDLGTMDTTVDGEKVFYGVWQKQSYGVTYSVDGVTDTTLSQNIEYGETVTVAAEPADITGYTFDGWYYDGTKYAAGDTLTMPAGAIAFEGTFEADTFDVIFNANGGAWSDDSTTVTNPTVFDSSITVPSNPSRSGYEFLGWAESADSSTTVTPGTLTEEGKTYYAVWKATIWNYTVNVYEMDTDGTYSADPTSSTTNSGQVASTAYYTPNVKTGFYVDADLSTNYDATTGQVSGVVTVDPALVLNVYLARSQYKVYTTIDGTRTEAGTFYYGQDVAIADAPDKVGYTFTGWNPAVESPMKAQDQEVTAIYEANRYDVIFNAGEGLVDGASTKTLSGTYGATLQSVRNNIATVTREGYELAGWSYTAGGSAINLETETVPVNGVTLYAIWEIQSYTATFRAGNGTFSENNTNTYSVTVTYGAEIPAPADPTRTGWSFTGWSPAVPDAMPASTQNFVAQWSINQYTITFDTDGGTAVDAITQNYGTDVTAPENPTKTGYTFAGWDTEIPTTMPAGNMTIKAQWTVNEYTITFDSNGGSEVAAITQDYGTDVTAPADPTKTGYTFAGWKPAVPATMPAENTTVVAQWTINQYTITFNTDGGSAVAAITQDYATDVTAPSNPTKTGYTFAGWDTTIPATMPAEDMTITAQWTINQYTITFDSDGGSAVDAITQDYGTAVTAPSDPTKTGYTFAGWSPAVPATIPAKDITLTAQWTINSYTVTWDYNGDDANTADKVDTYSYGASVTVPSNPTKTGYTFLGWMGSDGILYAAGQAVPEMDVADVTYTAEWSIDSHVVTWLNEDGTTYDSETYEYGASVSKPATDPVKTGYTFKGWKAADDTLYGEGQSVPAMGTSNVSYTAYFVINQYIIVFDAEDGAWATDADADGSLATYTIEADYNTLVTKPGNPSREGYSFEGWADADGNAVDVPAAWNVEAENVNYYAVWEIIQYTVTYVDAEGDSVLELTLDYGKAIPDPATQAGYTAPTLEHYTLEGWSLAEVALGQFKDDFATNGVELIDFANAPTVPANNITIYPAFARVVVTIAPVEGSTSIINVTSSESDPIEGYITGLQEYLTMDTLLNNYLTVEGDGRLEVTLTKYKVCGTGAKVYVYDNMGTVDKSDDKLVETYTIVIYGDVNGDSMIDATDVSILYSIGANNGESWNVPGSESYDEFKVIAADVDKTILPDGVHTIDPLDADLIEKVVLLNAEIDQKTGDVTTYSA